MKDIYVKSSAGCFLEMAMDAACKMELASGEEIKNYFEGLADAYSLAADNLINKLEVLHD